MFEGLGGGIEVDVEGGAAVELEMSDEGGAKGGLLGFVFSLVRSHGVLICS